MDRAIYVALSGVMMQERRLDVTTYNIANADTTGFKRESPLFATILSDMVRTYPVESGVDIDLSQGAFRNSGNPLDVAIQGKGFFVVKTPWGERYTRQGSFTLDPDGTLVTQDGYPVLGEQGEIRVLGPSVTIDEDGYVASDRALFGRLKVVSFADGADVRREGSFFRVDDADVVDGVLGAGVRVLQGYVESSNVNPVREMATMIEVMRRYETQTKMIQTLDEMTKKAIKDVAGF